MKCRPAVDAQRNAYNVFVKAAQSCIAYQSFLKKRNIQPKRLSKDQFHEIPISDKNSYLRKHSLNDLIYTNSTLSDFYMITTSSGSTGEPTIWPRAYGNDENLESLQSNFLNMHFHILTQKTLLVVMFGLGSTTAGMLTAKLCWDCAKRGNISVLTPGIDAEIGSAIEKIYSYYDQVVILGYPPVIEEMIRTSLFYNHHVRKWNVKICYTSENTSPIWRQQIAKAIDGVSSDIISFYACSESGIIGIETREGAKITQICQENEALRNRLFHSPHLPSLVSVNMEKKFIEVINNEIVITVDQPIPLIRYNLHDRGMLLTASQIRTAFNEYALDGRFIQNDSFYLAVFGKNEGPREHIFFFTEDIKYALERSALKKYRPYSFTYNEKQSKRTITIEIIISTRKFSLVKIQQTLTQEIQLTLEKIKHKELIHTRRVLNVQVAMAPPGEIPYKYGKLQYHHES